MTEGRRLLLELLTRTRQDFVAARCRVSQGAVSRWASGRSVPRAATRELLERWSGYGIPAAAWDRELAPERPRSVWTE